MKCQVDNCDNMAIKEYLMVRRNRLQPPVQFDYTFGLTFDYDEEDDIPDIKYFSVCRFHSNEGGYHKESLDILAGV